MFVYSAYLDDQKTFRMMPISNDCPYNEVIYDPTTKVLAIISKEFKQKPQMFPKYPASNSFLGNSSSTPEYVREMMDTYYEYYLDDPNDILSFIQSFAINPGLGVTSIHNAAVL